MTTGAIQGYFVGLSRNTFLLACTSLFADISTEMLYPILPVFLTQTLKASGSIPLMGLATVWQVVFAGRLLERFGAGTRSAPRDASRPGITARGTDADMQPAEDKHRQQRP